MNIRLLLILVLLVPLLSCKPQSRREPQYTPPAFLVTNADGPTVIAVDTQILSTGTVCVYSTLSDSTHALLPVQKSSCKQQFYKWAAKQPF